MMHRSNGLYQIPNHDPSPIAVTPDSPIWPVSPMLLMFLGVKQLKWEADREHKMKMNNNRRHRQQQKRNNDNSRNNNNARTAKRRHRNAAVKTTGKLGRTKRRK